MADYDHCIASLLTALSAKKQVIAEYGCGDGIWLEYLARQNARKTFIGVEWNEKLWRYAKDKRLKDYGNVELHHADATKFAVNCDMFYAFGVVEHFDESSDVMKLWTKALSPNGFAVITAPNLLNTVYNSRRFKMKIEDLLDTDEVIVDAYGFEQLWSHNRFLKKIMDAGLEILMFRILEELKTERPMLAVAFKRDNKNE